MKPIKLIIFVLALSISECRSGIIKKKSDSKKLEWLAKSAVSTLLSCYKKNVNAVGAAGITEPIIHKLLSNQSLPVILFGDDKKRAAVNKQARDDILRHKLQLFMVEVASTQQLERLFLRVQRSQRFYHMGTYLIIDWPSQKSQKSCSNAYKYLWSAWKYSILDAYYVCFVKTLHTKESVRVYSFNPYTNRAPAPWRLTRTFEGMNGHPWSLFVRDYHLGDQEICNNIHFVKNHDLGGYYIKTFIHTDLPSSKWTTQNALKEFRIYLYGTYIFKALNATPDVYLTPNAGPRHLWVARNPRRNITTNRIIQSAEIFLDIGNNIETINLTTSSRIRGGGLKILTQYRGQMSQLDKIIGVLDKSTRIGISLIVLITLLFFKYYARQPLGSAMLNVVRIIAYTNILREPKKVAPRFYLAGVYFLVVTIVGIYQGLIASLLTKPKPLSDVETLQDLIDSPHKIHGHEKFARFFTDPKFNGRFVGHDSFNCKDLVVRDPLAACVESKRWAIRHGLKLKLHVSRDDIIPMYCVYMIGPYLPFENRLNEIIGSFTESYITEYMGERSLQWLSEATEYKAKLERDRPSTIKLNDLGFAFAILGIGLGLATAAFIVEVAMKRV